MSGGIGPGGQGGQQAAAANLMAKLGLRNSGTSPTTSGLPNSPMPSNFTTWGQGSSSGTPDSLKLDVGMPGYPQGFPSWGTGGVDPAPVSDGNDIYKQLMAMASQGSAGDYSYDLNGALKDVANSYNPVLQNLDQLGKHKTAREAANEKSLNAVYAQLDQRLGATGKESRGNYDNTIGTNDKTYANESSAANQSAQERIAQMTADYTRLGQQDRIAGDTQKILNQRDQALERINAQGQALHGSTQQLQNANSNWFQQGQGISRFEGANAVRDQKAMLSNALDQLDSQRAGILSNQAQAQNSARNSYRASYKAPSGPDISQILAILSAQDAHGKALDAHAATGTGNSSALDALIQKGGLNGADAYAQAAKLPSSYSTALRDFITKTDLSTDPSTQSKMSTSKQLQAALQYAASAGLDPASFQSMVSKYLKL